MEEKIKQKELGDSPKEESEDSEWIADEYEDDAEVIKIQVGESIEGLLIDKYSSKKWNTNIYKIKVKNDEKPKVLLGTTILDKMMANKEINEEVKIERLEDKPSDKGNPIQQWKTYHKKEN